MGQNYLEPQNSCPIPLHNILLSLSLIYIIYMYICMLHMYYNVLYIYYLYFIYIYVCMYACFCWVRFDLCFCSKFVRVLRTNVPILPKILNRYTEVSENRNNSFKAYALQIHSDLLPKRSFKNQS